MFCPNCGKRNDDEALFCGACGQSLVEFKEEVQSGPLRASEEEKTAEETVSSEMPSGKSSEAVEEAVPSDISSEAAEEVVPLQMSTEETKSDQEKEEQEIREWKEGSEPKNLPKEKKPFSKRIWVILAEAVILTAALVAFVKIGSAQFGPKKVVQAYIKELNSGNYDAAYDLLHIDNGQSDLLSKKSFASVMQEDEFAKSKNATVNSVGGTYGGMTEAVAKISYGNGEDKTLTLIKTDKKGFFFFPKWKVKVDESLLAKKIAVRTPKGATVTVDNNKIEVKQPTESVDISALFVGKHRITSSLAGITVNRDINITNDDQTVDLTGGYIPDKKTQETMAKDGYELLSKYYEGLSKKKWSIVSDCISGSGTSIKESFEHTDSAIAYSKLSGNTAKLSSDGIRVNEDGEITYTMDFSYNIYTSYDKMEPSKLSDKHAEIVFVYKEEKWQIQDGSI